MNRLFAFLLACVFAQFSYGQKELSIKEMEDSMAHGNLNIQVDLATEYIVGNKVEQNHAKAYSLIRDAAEKDNRYGQLMLGFCYEDGIGVEKNLSESFNWFTRSAEQGNVVAQFKMSQFYEQGIEVERDLKKPLSGYLNQHNSILLLSYRWPNTILTDGALIPIELRQNSYWIV